MGLRGGGVLSLEESGLNHGAWWRGQVEVWWGYGELGWGGWRGTEEVIGEFGSSLTMVISFFFAKSDTR